MASAANRDAHPVSLKVLRLSRPSLPNRFSVPKDPADPGYQDGDDHEDKFIIGSAPTLPPSFGAAYVGEPFFCTLCANSELDDESDRQISGVKLVAEMQTPSGTLPLSLEPDDQSSDLLKTSVPYQRNVRFDLREEGSHTLAVNISYSETIISKDHAASGRIRTFRKLYQFAARPCLNVRTKVSASAGNSRMMALEAQIDNLADGTIVLNQVTLDCKPSFQATSLNWDAHPPAAGVYTKCPIMAPRDVYQVAFMIQEKAGGPAKEVMRDGRALVGNLGLRWRSEMGEEGYLTTGMLTTKRK